MYRYFRHLKLTICSQTLPDPSLSETGRSGEASQNCLHNILPRNVRKGVLGGPTSAHTTMVSLQRTIRSIRRVGLREWWRQMQYIGDAKSGRLVGKDQLRIVVSCRKPPY